MRLFIPCNMDWRLIVPGETGWERVDWAQAREVRLRPGQGAAVALPDGVWQGQYRLSSADIIQAAQALTGHALAARQAELSQGFAPLPACACGWPMRSRGLGRTYIHGCKDAPL